MKSGVILALIFAGGLAASTSASEEGLTPEILRTLTFDQKLNAQVGLTLPFRDENGEPTTIEECLARRPAILILGYYECPMLCNLVLNGVVESLQEIGASADSDARLIFVSIDSRETSTLARAKKRAYLKRLGQPGAARRWHFLTGEAAAVAQVADETGFRYRYDAAHKQFAHPSGIILLTPEGRVSSYMFGVNYPAGELKEGLERAAARQTGSRIKDFLVLCSQFVPLTGKFSGIVMTGVRSVAVLTLIGLIALAVVCRRKGERPAP